MKKIGVIVNNLRASQLSECVVDCFNYISESTSDTDTIAFYKKHPILGTVPLFSCMEQTEVWGYEGNVIATCLESPETLLKVTGPKKKYFYLWDLEWTRTPARSYSKIKSIYQNPNIELIARSESHAELIATYWKKPIAIIKDFEAKEILSLCGDEE